jgi:hypothetical protein
MTIILGILLGLLLSPLGLALGGAAGRGELSLAHKHVARWAVVATYLLFAATTKLAGGRRLAVAVEWR